MASPCVVCLAADGRGMRACACNNVIHAQCLVGMLEHHYKRCRVCLQPFTPESLLAAARYKLSRPDIFGTLMAFCSAATTASHDNESFAILVTVPADCLGDVDLAQYLYERGRCLAKRRRFDAAENNFVHALRLLRKHPECSIRPLAWALSSLAAARLDLSKLNEAAGSLQEAVLLMPRLPAEVAEGVMRVVARYCLLRGDVCRHAKALKTINDIVRKGCPCPVSRATAYLEMRLGEAAACEEILETGEAFQASLRALRRSRSHPELVVAASRLLGSRCPPKKRIRVKTHAEEAAV